MSLQSRKGLKNLIVKRVCPLEKKILFKIKYFAQ